MQCKQRKQGVEGTLCVVEGSGTKGFCYILFAGWTLLPCTFPNTVILTVGDNGQNVAKQVRLRKTITIHWLLLKHFQCFTL